MPRGLATRPTLRGLSQPGSDRRGQRLIAAYLSSRAMLGWNGAPLTIDRGRHAVIHSSHPSPLSAWRGFLTSNPFSDANKNLTRLGRGQIDWERVGRDD